MELTSILLIVIIGILIIAFAIYIWRKSIKDGNNDHHHKQSETLAPIGRESAEEYDARIRRLAEKNCGHMVQEPNETKEQFNAKYRACLDEHFPFENEYDY